MAVGQKEKPEGPNWHRRAVGEPKHWRSVGERQRDFLIEQGLQPHHTVLDLGCGGLRAGVRLIPYLDKGRYFGLDNEPMLLDAARETEVVGEIAEKEPTLLCNSSFDLSETPEFDYVLAQSLFTHLTLDQIDACVRAVLGKLAPGGKFFATMNISPDGKDHTGQKHNWREERDVTRYPFMKVRDVIENAGGTAEYMGRWGHPKYDDKPFLQRMIVIRRAEEIPLVRPLQDAVTTMVLYHPKRPLKCLERALRCLNKATTLPHRVEVIVQGPEEGELPNPSSFDHMELVYLKFENNVGTGPRLRAAVKRFLETDHKWFAKYDDDMSTPPGAWDAAIQIHEEEKSREKYSLGAVMVAVPQRMWSGVPRLLRKQEREGKLPRQRWYLKSYAERKNSIGSWHVCDFADHGCTVFSREPFEEGVLPDPTYFTGGNDWDLCYQLLDKGYKSALCTDPRSDHHHKECKPGPYKRIRYRPAETRRSGEHFMEKWGLEIEMLTTFGGFGKSAWNPKQQRFVPRKKGKAEE